MSAIELSENEGEFLRIEQEKNVNVKLDHKCYFCGMYCRITYPLVVQYDSLFFGTVVKTIYICSSHLLKVFRDEIEKNDPAKRENIYPIHQEHMNFGEEDRP
jgi:hypothetical protein